jgi:micrococcal nuclease
MLRTLAPILLAAGMCLATPALADPCTRIPDRGAAPAEAHRGAVFAGPVVYVGDGDSLCVETVGGIGGRGWVEVRLADFNAPEISESGGRAARATLSRLVMGRRLTCVGENRTWDRIAARCTLNGQPVRDLLRRAGVREGGN